MKGISFLLFYFFFILASAQNTFFQGSWEELRETACKDTMPFIVDFYWAKCAPCKIMDKILLGDTVQNYIQGKYLLFRIDVETPFGKKMVRKYRAMGFPMLAYFDHRGKLMGRYIGYLYAYEFEELSEKYYKKFLRRKQKKKKSCPTLKK